MTWNISKSQFSICGLSFAALLILFSTQLVRSAKTEEDIKVKFKLFTYLEDQTGIILNPDLRKDEDDAWIENAEFNSLLANELNNRSAVKILIHGFKNNAEGKEPFSFPLNVKNAYLNETKNGEEILRNVITVDWSSVTQKDPTKKGLLPPLDDVKLYRNAVSNVEKVGRKVAELLAYMHDNDFLYSFRIHCVGHDLGAHVCGAAGDSLKKLLQKYGANMGRITGLDPAGPLFYSSKLGRPLSDRDARFVDVVHTDQGISGKEGKMGHVDFYPNGGFLEQYRCRASNPFHPIFNPFTDLLSLGYLCSHSESHRLFAKTVGSIAVTACKSDVFLLDFGYCDTNYPRIPFGENCPLDAYQGKYYFALYDNVDPPKDE